MEQIKPQLLEILACPKCKSSVIEREGNIACTGGECGLVYPVRDGIPIMLIEEASTPDKPASPLAE